MHVVSGIVAAPLLTSRKAAAAGERFLVKMTGRNQFSPGGIVVPLGATVVWQNFGTGRHTATCDPVLAAELTNLALPPGAAPWSSGDLWPGQTWEQTFTISGTFLYFCRYHELAGMLGTITVIDAGPEPL